MSIKIFLQERPGGSYGERDTKRSFDSGSVGSGGSTGGYESIKRSPEQGEGSSRKKMHTGGDEAGPSSSSGRGTSSSRGRGGRSNDKSERPKRDRYEIIRTQPEGMTTKMGSSGDHLRLKANFFELMKRPDYEMVMYRVDFEPECELAPVRKYLMYTQRKLLGAYLYDTRNSVYLTHRLPQDTITVDTEDKEKNPFKITIKFGTIVSMDTRESLQVLNLILRRAMEGLNLQLIGRNLFDPLGKVSSIIENCV